METPFPAYRGDEKYVFVCFAHDDQHLVYPQITWLNAQGVNIWYDEGISPGQEWTQELADAIARSDRVLYFVTPRSVESRHCRNEIQYANSHEVPVVSIHLESTELPGGLALSLGLDQAILKHELGAEEFQRKLLAATGVAASHSAPVADFPTARRGRVFWSAVGLTILTIATLGLWWFGARESPNPMAPATQQSVDPRDWSIAVLPFEDLSPAQDQRWLANGMSEALVIYLSRVEDLRVVQARQGGDLQEIGARLGVRSILLGSIFRDGDHLRVTARLVNASDGSEMWSASYERAFDEVLELQREVSRAILPAVESKLGIQFRPNALAFFNEARVGTRDLRAYELWRKGWELRHGPDRSEETLGRALQYSLESVAIDPEFTLGFVGVGASHLRLFLGYWDPQNKRAAIEAFEQALVMEPDNYVVIANWIVLAVLDRQWERIADVVPRVTSKVLLAEASNAFSMRIMALLNLGRWEEAGNALDDFETLVRQRPERFPPTHRVHVDIATALYLLRRDYPGVVEHFEPALVSTAGTAWRSHMALVDSQVALGEPDKAVETFTTFLAGPFREAVRNGYAEAGWTGALRGFVAEYRREEPERCGFTPTSVDAELGQTDIMYECLERDAAAFECSRRAIDSPGQIENCPLVETAPYWTSPRFDRYRNEPRFQAILERNGIIGYRNAPSHLR